MNMVNGRPAENSCCTKFQKKDKPTTDEESKKEESKEYQPYEQIFSGQVDKEMKKNGPGKYWYKDGEIYNGPWKDNKKLEKSTKLVS